ncbi:MAG: hypothetical protein H6732_19325 [Alphaproteobacteria bacterium]|nr:hypothetical protein [Alphaproteobacteria bacterium]
MGTPHHRHIVVAWMATTLGLTACSGIFASASMSSPSARADSPATAPQSAPKDPSPAPSRDCRALVYNAAHRLHHAELSQGEERRSAARQAVAYAEQALDACPRGEPGATAAEGMAGKARVLAEG